MRRAAVVFGLATAWAMLSAGCPASGELPVLAIESPQQNSAFSAGSTVRLRLRVENFDLTEPLSFGDHSSHKSSASGEDSTAQIRGPFLNYGHYHVYLNDDSGNDPHVMGWTTTVDFPLPADLAVGPHSLRVELRDDRYRIIGVEDVLFFRCVEP